MPKLSELVVQISARLRLANVAHAFGGAIALGFWAPPRATADIDLNIFAGPDRWNDVFGALETAGFVIEPDVARFAIHTIGEFRVDCEGVELDLFFPFAEFHQEVRKRVVTQPWPEGHRIPVISAEDLVLFKVTFDRPKDWLDIENIVLQQGERLDAAYLRNWLPRLVPEDDPRCARLDALLRS